MTNYKQKLGKYGELLAQCFLLKQGYKLLEINYRTNLGEIDIIAEDNDYLVFIEVKSQKSQIFKAVENVTRKKQLKIAQVANLFLYENDYKNTNMRFDVITVDVTTDKIELIKNAFII